MGRQKKLVEYSEMLFYDWRKRKIELSQAGTDASFFYY